MTDATPRPMLLKHQTLLDLVVPGPDQVAEFASYAKADGADEDGFDYPEVYITADDYRAMGEPRQITVTIEPGDRMNGAAL